VQRSLLRFLLLKAAATDGRAPGESAVFSSARLIEIPGSDLLAHRVLLRRRGGPLSFPPGVDDVRSHRSPHRSLGGRARPHCRWSVWAVVVEPGGARRVAVLGLEIPSSVSALYVEAGTARAALSISHVVGRFGRSRCALVEASRERRSPIGLGAVVGGVPSCSLPSASLGSLSPRARGTRGMHYSTRWGKPQSF